MGYDFDRNGHVDGRDYYLMNELLSDDDEFESDDFSCDDEEESVNTIEENRFELKSAVSQLIEISVLLDSIIDDSFMNGDESGPLTPLDYIMDAKTYVEQAYEAIEEALNRCE